MATRFYFDSSATPTISPAFDSTAWNGRTDQATRRRLNASVQSSALTNFLTNGASANATFVLAVQFIIEGLASQTLSGSIKGQVRCVQSAAASNATLAVRVAVCASDGSGMTEALAVSASDNVATAPPEFTTTATNRRMLDVSESTPLTLGSVSVPSNGCLVVEMGWRNGNTTNTGRSATLRFGDSGASDFAENDTTTTDLNPWIEFTHDFTYGGVTGQPTMRRWGGVPHVGGTKRFGAGGGGGVWGRSRSGLSVPGRLAAAA